MPKPKPKPMPMSTKERPFKCPESNCEYSGARSWDLKQHGLVHEPKEGEERPSFPCPICEYSTERKGDLLKHIKSHILEKLFKCDEPNCSYEAKRGEHMKNHKLVHSDEKPIACSFHSCEYRCKRKKDLSSHLKIHSEERPYKCELCPFRGRTRKTVTAHLKQVHSDPSCRPFKCTERNCGSAFNERSSLNRHLLRHQGDKKYLCSFPDCDYRAVLKELVKQHENHVHQVEKNHKCGLCDYAAKAKGRLVYHMRTHTKETPYKCMESNCEYRSTTPSNLKQHQKKYHSHVSTEAEAESESESE